MTIKELSIEEMEKCKNLIVNEEDKAMCNWYIEKIKKGELYKIKKKITKNFIRLVVYEYIDSLYRYVPIENYLLF